jgi:GLPGLI family protein
MLCAFLASTTYAQKSNAHIQYVMNFETSGSEEDAAMAAMMNGSLIDIYFAPDNSKMMLNMMSGMMKMDMRMNTKSEKGIMLMDMMGQQKYKTIDADDVNEEEKPSDVDMPEIKYLKKYKEIAGYKCQKALITVKDQAEPVVVYFTDKLEMPKGFEKYTDQLNMAGIKGFPMAIEIVASELKINITAQAVDFVKQSKKIFDLKAPEGYTEMTEQDLQGLGGLGGGL